jgi:hypothetical protein
VWQGRSVLPSAASARSSIVDLGPPANSSCPARRGPRTLLQTLTPHAAELALAPHCTLCVSSRNLLARGHVPLPHAHSVPSIKLLCWIGLGRWTRYCHTTWSVAPCDAKYLKHLHELHWSISWRLTSSPCRNCGLLRPEVQATLCWQWICHNFTYSKHRQHASDWK